MTFSSIYDVVYPPTNGSNNQAFDISHINVAGVPSYGQCVIPLSPQVSFAYTDTLSPYTSCTPDAY
jgi:hypothetical protein